jgi:hypothetical protein
MDADDNRSMQSMVGNVPDPTYEGQRYYAQVFNTSGPPLDQPMACTGQEIFADAYLLQCLLVPVLHPALSFFTLLPISPVTVEINFCCLALNVQVMTELALEALGALPMAEELAQDRLWIHT